MTFISSGSWRVYLALAAPCPGREREAGVLPKSAAKMWFRNPMSYQEWRAHKRLPDPPESEPERKRYQSGEGYVAAQKRLTWMLGDPCAYCGGPADTWDHITPRKRGGGHSDDNLCRVCFPCNSEKSSRTLLTFLAIRAKRKAAGAWKPRERLMLRGGSTNQVRI